MNVSMSASIPSFRGVNNSPQKIRCIGDSRLNRFPANMLHLKPFNFNYTVGTGTDFGTLVAFSEDRQNQARCCTIKNRRGILGTTGAGLQAAKTAARGQAACHVYRSAILCASVLRAARKIAGRPPDKGRSPVKLAPHSWYPPNPVGLAGPKRIRRHRCPWESASDC